MNCESLSSIATAIGVGFFAGVLIGYALKKVSEDSSWSSWTILRHDGLTSVSADDRYKMITEFDVISKEIESKRLSRRKRERKVGAA